MAKNVFVFPDTAKRDIDVIVAVPKEHRINGNKYPIIVKEKVLGKDKSGNNLVPPIKKRLIINFAIYYVTNAGDKLLKDIKPHFEVWVGYKESEAGDKLVYYDDTLATADWVDMNADKAISPHGPISGGQHKYNGYGYVKRSKWGDPNLGWG